MAVETNRPYLEAAALGAPIHRDASQRFRRLSATLFAFSVFALLVVVLSSRTTLSIELLAACLLVLLAEHRFTLFSDETYVSSSIGVLLASVVAFQDQAPLIAPMVCGMCAMVDWPSLSKRSWWKPLFNGASFALSGLAAALAYMSSSSILSPDVGALMALAFAVLLFWFVNNSFVALGLAVLEGGSVLRRLRQLVCSETRILLVAVAGAAAGHVYVEVGPGAGLATLGVVLLVADVFVVRARWRSWTLLRSARAAWTAGSARIVPHLLYVSVLGGAVVLGRRQGSVQALLVGSSVLMARVVADRRFRRPSVLGAAGLGSAALIGGATCELLSRTLGSDMFGSVAACGVGALVGLVAYGLFAGVVVARGLGPVAWNVVGGFLRADLALAPLVGVAIGGGWLWADVGVAAASVLVAGALVADLVILQRRAGLDSSAAWRARAVSDDSFDDELLAGVERALRGGALEVVPDRV